MDKNPYDPEIAALLLEKAQEFLAERNVARAEHVEAEQKLKKVIFECYVNSIPVRTIAGILGVTRQYVHDVAYRVSIASEVKPETPPEAESQSRPKVDLNLTPELQAKLDEYHAALEAEQRQKNPTDT
jgi:hypothetical protein